MDEKKSQLASMTISLLSHFFIVWGMGTVFLAQEIPHPPEKNTVKISVVSRPNPLEQVEEATPKKTALKPVPATNMTQPVASEIPKHELLLKRPIQKRPQTKPPENQIRRVSTTMNMHFPKPVPAEYRPAGAQVMPEQALSMQAPSGRMQLNRLENVAPVSSPSRSFQEKTAVEAPMVTAHLATAEHSTRKIKIQKKLNEFVNSPPTNARIKAAMVSHKNHHATKQVKVTAKPVKMASFKNNFIIPGQEAVLKQSAAYQASDFDSEIKPVQMAFLPNGEMETWETGDSDSKNLKKIRAAFNQSVWERIRNAKYYPEIARLRRVEGRAVVRFLLNADGTLKKVEIIKKSGHDILDKAALNAVQLAAPFLKIPRELGVASLEFKIPISYVLN